MSYVIYHNPRCQKSRQTLELLLENDVKPTVVEYLKTPFSKNELKSILSKLKLKPSELIRRKEDLVKKLKLDLSNEEKVFQAMLDHPELIERPIVVSGDHAVLGRPPENVLKLL